jgi:hypothetical protein
MWREESKKEIKNDKNKEKSYIDGGENYNKREREREI